jgi:hypothetical protein
VRKLATAETLAGFMPVDRADDWLHVGFGIGMLYAGLAAGLSASRPRPAAAS